MVAEETYGLDCWGWTVLWVIPVSESQAGHPCLAPLLQMSLLFWFSVAGANIAEDQVLPVTGWAQPDLLDPPLESKV